MTYTTQRLIARWQKGRVHTSAGRRSVARRITLAIAAAAAAQLCIAVTSPTPALAADAVTIAGTRQVYCYWSAAAGAVRKHVKSGGSLSDVTWEILPSDSPDSKKCAQERAKRALERLKKRAGVQ